MNRLQEKYNNEIVPAMIEKFGYKNIMQVPKLNKIVINIRKLLSQRLKNLSLTSRSEKAFQSVVK